MDVRHFDFLDAGGDPTSGALEMHMLMIVMMAFGLAAFGAKCVFHGPSIVKYLVEDALLQIKRQRPVDRDTVVFVHKQAFKVRL